MEDKDSKVTAKASSDGVDHDIVVGATGAAAASSSSVPVITHDEPDVKVDASTDPSPSVKQTVTLTAPPQATAGSTIVVTWTGPGESGDYIAVSEKNATGYLQYSYVYPDSDTVKLLLPPNAGAYDIKYMQEESQQANCNSALGKITIQLFDALAQVMAPNTAVAGSTIPVDWEGPNNDGDYIGISAAGRSGYLHYSYLYGNHPVQLLLPAEPGQYDIKYMMERHNDKVLATKSITLTAADASIVAPARAMASSTIEVQWTGPGNDGDYVAISGLGNDGYLHYAYLTANPTLLLTPPDAAEYEIRYIMGQHDDRVLARCTINLEAVSASIQAPESTVAAREISIEWSGPGNDSDYLAISHADHDECLVYAYFHNQHPVKIQLPNKPGSYDLKYILGQHNDKVLAKSRIQILPRSTK
jgi:Ca-activated chloride channel family protein